jgi:hypothetical protein
MNPTRFKNFASIMVAIVTILGASAVCLGSVATNEAGNADFDGLAAAISNQEAQIINEINAYEHYRTYTAYYRYDELVKIYEEELLNFQGNDQQYNALEDLYFETLTVRNGLFYYLELRYLNSEGGYDVERDFFAGLAETGSKKDLNSEPHFNLANSLRNKALLFTGVLIFLAIAFWFFTAAEITDNRAKYFFFSVGLILTLISVGAGLYIQFTQ